MVAQYADLTKLRHAKMIAREGGCFIVERGEYDNKEFILYRNNNFGPNDWHDCDLCDAIGKVKSK